MEKKLINPWKWQDNFGFSQAVEITGHTRVLRCAGQQSTSPDGEAMHVGDMKAQIAQAVDNLETVLKAAGMNLGNIVRLNLFTTDVDAFFEHFGVMAERLAAADCKPAMTLLGVTALAFGLSVEIEATAVA